MTIDHFSDEVAGRLKWYVYRLIDPRNGETFYVGKGRGNRLFEHAKGALALDNDEDAGDLKVQRIKAITAAGLEVAHLIHRHGLEEKVAYQVEAALIDAYPGLANRVSGHGAGDYGVRHVREIIADYAAEPFVVTEPLILISIPRSYENEVRNIYDAVRGCWRINPDKAAKFNLVLAHRRGIVLGAFRPTKWVSATKTNFPWLEEDIPGRFGFEGTPAETAAVARYVGTRVPEAYRAKGAANPVRFINDISDLDSDSNKGE